MGAQGHGWSHVQARTVRMAPHPPQAHASDALAPPARFRLCHRCAKGTAATWHTADAKRVPG